MIVAALQARMGSQRLPGKVLADIGGRPMLARQVDRIRRARRIDQLCIATSVEREDDAIAELADSIDVACHRGPAVDVLERIWQAGQRFDASHVVRLTGDCPLTDPAVVDRVVEAHLGSGNALTSNAIDRTWPDGLDVEVVTMAALTSARLNATDASDREHVTRFLYQPGNGFRVGAFHADGAWGNERWTVDYAEDLEFVRAVFAAFAGREADFSSMEVIELLRRQPGLSAINVVHRQDAAG